MKRSLAQSIVAVAVVGLAGHPGSSSARPLWESIKAWDAATDLKGQLNGNICLRLVDASSTQSPAKAPAWFGRQHFELVIGQLQSIEQASPMKTITAALKRLKDLGKMNRINLGAWGAAQIAPAALSGGMTVAISAAATVGGLLIEEGINQWLAKKAHSVLNDSAIGVLGLSDFNRILDQALSDDEISPKDIKDWLRSLLAANKADAAVSLTSQLTVDARIKDFVDARTAVSDTAKLPETTPAQAKGKLFAAMTAMAHARLAHSDLQGDVLAWQQWRDILYALYAFGGGSGNSGGSADDTSAVAAFVNGLLTSEISKAQLAKTAGTPALNFVIKELAKAADRPPGPPLNIWVSSGSTIAVMLGTFTVGKIWASWAAKKLEGLKTLQLYAVPADERPPVFEPPLPGEETMPEPTGLTDPVAIFKGVREYVEANRYVLSSALMEKIPAATDALTKLIEHADASGTDQRLLFAENRKSPVNPARVETFLKKFDQSFSAYASQLPTFQENLAPAQRILMALDAYEFWTGEDLDLQSWQIFRRWQQYCVTSSGTPAGDDE